mmetsp:Transcript_36844/g.40692  ORF Transcript_36844/g.40692 Transcript_36844/m.40692 type:complete len:455 (+) Transcript_36844:64-1428(+)
MITTTTKRIKIINLLSIVLLLLLRIDSTKGYNDATSDCNDVCQGLFLFETFEEGIECCSHTRKLILDEGVFSPNQPDDPIQRYELGNCLDYGPAESRVQFYYGPNLSEEEFPTLWFGPYRFGKGAEFCNNGGLPPPRPQPNLKRLYPIIGGVLGGLTLIGGVILMLRPTREKENLAFMTSRLTRLTTTSTTSSPPLQQLPQHAAVGKTAPERRINSDIFVAEQQGDEISTLGDPMYSNGMAMIMQQHRMEKDETVVGSLDYDYQKHHRPNHYYNNSSKITPGKERENSLNISALKIDTLVNKPKSNNSNKDLSSSSDLSSMTYTDNGAPLSSSRLRLSPNMSLFCDDDVSFEQQFRDDLEERFEVVVPAGKLGMVIDTNNGGVPFVHSIRDTSVLVDRVRMGDRLLSVDDIDTTECTAAEVSKLISSKDKQIKRILQFSRTVKTRYCNSSAEEI